MRYVIFSKDSTKTTGVIGSTCYGWKDGPEGVIEAINEGMLKPLGMEIVAEAAADSDTHLLLLRSSELSPDALREATDEDWVKITEYVSIDSRTEEEKAADKFIEDTEQAIANYSAPLPTIEIPGVVPVDKIEEDLLDTVKNSGILELFSSAKNRIKRSLEG